jgi:hypothetical protein
MSGNSCLLRSLLRPARLSPPCSADGLQRVMEEFELGPNGGLIFCMEYLLEHFDWLQERLQGLSCPYVIFDCPGQVELYTHHTSVQKIIERLQCGARSGRPDDLDCRLCSVHLVDSYYCRLPPPPPPLPPHSSHCLSACPPPSSRQFCWWPRR